MEEIILLRSVRKALELIQKDDKDTAVTLHAIRTWCKENKVECITLELPRQSGEEIVRDYQKGFTEILINGV